MTLGFLHTILLAAALSTQAPQTTPPSALQPPAAGYVAPIGQAWHYQAEWRLWNAGTATLKMEAVNGEHRIHATGDAQGFVALLYHVADKFDSAFDPKASCSARLTKHTEEGLRRRDTNIRYDYARGKAALDETNLRNNEKKHAERDIPACVTDVISGIYYVASQTLEPGATLRFPLNDGGETVDVTVAIEAREDVKTPAGAFHALRAQPTASKGPLKEKGKIWIWYSDDAQHIPVQMKARMFWGTLTLRLTRVEK